MWPLLVLENLSLFIVELKNICKYHQGALLINQQEPSLSACGKNTTHLPISTLLEDGDKLGQIHQRGEVLKEECIQGPASRNGASNRNTGIRRQTRGKPRPLLPSFPSDRLGVFSSRALPWRSIHRILPSLRGQSTHKTSPSAVPWGAGSSLPPASNDSAGHCSPTCVSVTFSRAQRKTKANKQQQQKTLPPGCLECKLSCEILSQVLLHSGLVSLFLTPPQWRLGRFPETGGLDVTSSFLSRPKSRPKSDNANTKLLSQCPVCVFLIKAFIWSIRPVIS